jgi:beta-lactamase class A
VFRYRYLISSLALAGTVSAVAIGADQYASIQVGAHAKPHPSTRSSAVSDAVPLVGDGVSMTQVTEDQAAIRRAANVRVAAQQRRQRNQAALTAALQRYDRSADLAVVVVDRVSGRTYSYSGRTPYATASIVKVDILATLLLQDQWAGRALTAQEKALAEDMIEDSDNAAATQLWNRTGGISAGIRTFGLVGTRGGGDGYWGLTTTTAEDQARLLLAVSDPHGPLRDGGYLLGLMSNVDRDQAWGISAAAQPGERVALKNGWFPFSGQVGWTVNSIGRISDADTDTVVVVLSRGHPSLRAGINMVETVTKLTRQYLQW